MYIFKYIIYLLYGLSKKLSNFEKLILDSIREHIIREHIDSDIIKIWDNQILAINKIQRLPDGSETCFYRIKNGKPTFDLKLSFINDIEELKIATVELKLKKNKEKIIATVWSINGFIFSIEYKGDINFFINSTSFKCIKSELKITVDLKSDLSNK